SLRMFAPVPWAGLLTACILLGARAGVLPPPCVSPRTRDEIDAERKTKREETWAEVKRVVAEYHALLPRAEATAVGSAYARHSSKHQDSVADQIRTMFADAVRKRVFIPLEHVYFDLAVRGRKSDRDGLNRLRECSIGDPRWSSSS